MKSNFAKFACVTMFVAASAHAQLYKWVGPDGKITYSDTPPPKTATKVEKKDIGIGSAGVDTSGFPYELAEAVKNSPVTLYTMKECPACDEARNFLNTRGVPFKEKTIATRDDQTKLKEAGGGNQLPFVTIGRNKLSQFSPEEWGSTLSNAGYPASNVLPKTFRNPPAEAAAPPASAEQAKQDTTAQRPSRQSAPAPATPAAPAGNAPPGFRF